MSDTSYIAYHQRLIAQLAQHIRSTAPFNGDALDEVQGEFIQKLDQLSDSSTAAHEQRHLGQALLNQIVSSFPHITPSVPRALFWYFGGDCMHYLGDEEIAHFQMLEERYFEQGKTTTNYEKLVLSCKERGNTPLH